MKIHIPMRTKNAAVDTAQHGHDFICSLCTDFHINVSIVQMEKLIETPNNTHGGNDQTSLNQMLSHFDANDK